ncbi:hypothetical protein L1049_025182 [Liquidambar formosana]|uniref:HXXXD-type acyl-transferase family protein n=1 Tax=Liquidambar formosana TaxID=63359 RepID=A0AAP0S356_LIQFO
MNMKGIRFFSTRTVRPTNHKESAQRIELTPWDLQLILVDGIQKGLLFLKPTPQQQNEMVNTLIQHLETSLSCTLDFFYPLAGRLTTTKNDDNSTSFFIQCNNAGAEFTHAVADGVTVAEILKPVYVPRLVHSFFPLNGVHNFEGTSKPLLAVQVTELVDGIFVGCTINHVVVDGTTFWHFFNSWSEISRGSNHVSNPPFLQRWFLDGIDCPIRLHLPQDEQLFNKFIPPPPPLQERVFHFTKEKIAGLKAKANAEIGTDRISSLQAILAHLWQAIIRSRHLGSDQAVNYRLLVGVRPRLDPPLPSHYFGNALQVGTATLKAGELLENGIGYAAWQMNQMVALQTDETIRNFLESWVKEPKLFTLGNIINKTAVATGSSPRFNVYGTDFGWGRPVAVRSGAGNKSDGKLTVFPGVEEGSVDVEACLSAQTLEAIGDDAEFMEAVAI